MKRIILLILFILAATIAVNAQPSSNTARHITYGSSLPATCNPNTGDVFFKTSATIGLYQCLTTNTWTAVPTSAGSGTVTSVSVTTANGVSGSVATATTTPAITLTLGAITPTTVNGNTFTTGTYTLTGTAGKTLNFLKTLTLDGTDSTTHTFPSTNSTVARTDAAQSFIGAQTFLDQLLAPTGGAKYYYSFTGSTTTGIYLSGGLVFGNANADSLRITNPDLQVRNNTCLNWNSAGSIGGSLDTGICRNAAGLISLTNGGATNYLIAGNGGITRFNNVATAGLGVPAIYGVGRATAQTAANASVATYTVGAADGSFEISANVLVTTATTHAFTVTCTYTDEGNTSRTVTLTFSQLAGTFLTSIANAAGAVPYEGVPLHIRCKASTSITIATTGTFTSVVYNVEGIIKQMS